MRSVLDVMGMPVTIDVRDVAVGPEAVEEAFAEFRLADRLFSTFRPDSEVSRIDRGALQEEAASDLVTQVLDLCRQYQRATDGWFSAWIRGHLDPSGLVKSWAMNRACSVLERHGARNYL